MLKRIRDWLHPNDRSDPPIHIDADGFWYTTMKGVDCRLRWDEIREIRAYKIDLLTTDEVRFAFQMDGWWAEASEEQPGFQELLKQLEARFPGVVGWQEKVILPPFERNETILYGKSYTGPRGD